MKSGRGRERNDTAAETAATGEEGRKGEEERQQYCLLKLKPVDDDAD